MWSPSPSREQGLDVSKILGKSETLQEATHLWRPLCSLLLFGGAARAGQDSASCPQLSTLRAVLPASRGAAGPGCTWESPGLGQSGFRRGCDAGFYCSFPRHPLIQNDPMQLSAWRPRVSTPWPVPSAEILVVMTSSTYAQEDINNCLFAPDKKVLESAALGSWRLAVLLGSRDPHA